MPVDCSDGIDCTVDACDEIDDRGVSTPNDNLCPDDGLFCTGQEICDVFEGCLSTGDPCPSGATCNEDTDSCDGDTDVTLCHIPRGNPDKARTITPNNPNATRAHLKHAGIVD